MLASHVLKIKTFSYKEVLCDD